MTDDTRILFEPISELISIFNQGSLAELTFRKCMNLLEARPASDWCGFNLEMWDNWMRLKEFFLK